MFCVARAYTVVWLHRLYAELLKRKGDLSGAEENLNTAVEIYRECGADGWVTKAEEALAGM